MTIANILTANEIVNQAAVECGLTPVTNPLASTDQSFIKFKYLLNTAGRELAMAYNWEFLRKGFNVVTQEGDTGNYQLPEDFLKFIEDTGWDRSSRIPMRGALSPQQWSFLEGWGMANNTLYPYYRVSDGQFQLYPQPPQQGMDINLEYISSAWVVDSSNTANRLKEVQTGADKPLFDGTLLSRYLKLKYLEAGGFDTAKAQGDFNQIFAFVTGTDGGGGQIIDAGGVNSATPLLGYNNIPETGYGQ